MKIHKIYTFLIILIMTCYLSTNNEAIARTNLSVSSSASSVMSGKSLLQYLSAVGSTNGSYKLIIIPTTDFLVNTTHPSSRISINKLEVENVDTHNYYPLDMNAPLEIMTGKDNENFNNRIGIRIKDAEAYYPGTYTCNLQFTLVSEDGSSTAMLNAVFNIPEINDIRITPANININISPKISSQQSYKKEPEFPTQIHIRSNKKWKLILNSLVFDNSFNYAFKVLPLNGDYKTYYSSEYTSLSKRSFVIAEGEATISADSTFLESKVIEVNYLLQNNSTIDLTAGSYPANINYELITD